MKIWIDLMKSGGKMLKGEIKDVEANTVVAGNPARVIKRI